MEPSRGAEPRSREGTRRRILDAACRLFAEHGYDEVTMRMLGAAANANIALINRYFGSKRELFAEVLAQQGRFPGVLDEGDDLAVRLAEYVADRLAAEGDSPVMATLERSASSPQIRELAHDRVRTALLEPLLARLGGEEAELRASLATMIILGSGRFRYLFGSIAPGTREETVSRLTRVFRACLS
ncbi:TetR family transcriptional regulator [Nonomuraea sp. SMC257]|uniref:TetR family transcriptional regulator n=1 Tax=Nonomuraea montanisoli TaxID=2741721 RepID=A0A7Y6I5Z0_9ACTN|nr:TetR/AcrR family transcriptional regulator [Nonomuraea montanisoli]NUW31059.1 TetR family transcriptional regulator [Nonomuraea montanisoli]